MSEQSQPSRAPERNPEGLRVVERLIASVVLISRDGKILMGQKPPKHGGAYSDDDYWHIPGGGIDDDIDQVFLPDGSVDQEATAQAAARREVGEEVLGLDLTDVELHRIPTGHGESAKTLPTGEIVWAAMTFNRFEAHLSETAAELEIHVTPGPRVRADRLVFARRVS